MNQPTLSKSFKLIHITENRPHWVCKKVTASIKENNQRHNSYMPTITIVCLWPPKTYLSANNLIFEKNTSWYSLNLTSIEEKSLVVCFETIFVSGSEPGQDSTVLLQFSDQIKRLSRGRLPKIRSLQAFCLDKNLHITRMEDRPGNTGHFKNVRVGKTLLHYFRYEH